MAGFLSIYCRLIPYSDSLFHFVPSLVNVAGFIATLTGLSSHPRIRFPFQAGHGKSFPSSSFQQLKYGQVDEVPLLGYFLHGDPFFSASRFWMIPTRHFFPILSLLGALTLASPPLPAVEPLHRTIVVQNASPVSSNELLERYYEDEAWKKT